MAGGFPRDYIVTVRFQRIGQPPAPEDRIERVEVTAYEAGEAVYQACVMLDARMGGLADNGIAPKLVNVEPNCATAAAKTETLLRDIALTLMPSKGKRS